MREGFLDNYIDNFAVCKISQLLIPPTAGICFPEEKMGFAFPSHAKLGLLTLDTNPGPALRCCPEGKRESGGSVGNGKWEIKQSAKKRKARFWGGMRSTPAHNPPSCAACVHRFVFSLILQLQLWQQLLRERLKYKFDVQVEESTELFKWCRKASAKSVCSISAVNVLFPNSIPRSLKEQKGLIWNAPVYIRILNMPKLFQIIVLLVPAGITQGSNPAPCSTRGTSTHGSQGDITPGRATRCFICIRSSLTSN